MTEQSRSRGPYAKSALRRAEISQAALEIVDELGHEALTTAAVAGRVGMSERAIAYHFPTKDDLMVAAARRGDEAVVVPVEEGDALYVTSFEVLGDMVARDHMSHVNRRRLFSLLSALALDPDHPARAYITEHTAAARWAFANIIRGRQRLGLAHPDLDPDAVARQMLAIWNGLANQWVIEPSFDLAHEIQSAFEHLTSQPAMEARALVESALAQI